MFALGIKRMEAGLVSCGNFWFADFFCCSFILLQEMCQVVFFPKGDPNFIYVYLKLPVVPMWIIPIQLHEQLGK